MQKTILIATERKTGKDIVLVDTGAGYPAQRDAYREFQSETHEEYSHVGLYHLIPVKKPLKFISKSEKENRQKQHAAQLNPTSTNEFKAAEIQSKGKGELLSIIKKLVEAKRLEMPKSTAKVELVSAILSAQPLATTALNQQPMQEPEEFKSKTNQELLDLITKLETERGEKIQLKPEANREDIVYAIVKATEANPARKEPGFFAKLFAPK